ncbi:kelch-like protein 6 [Branchiostoma lanceolatum]|uniref:kelch-like protein 6 n=1 Tax=Branchiostoma lanceolatum TaxID=7740 RepID=UPI0034529947
MDDSSNGSDVDQSLDVDVGSDDAMDKLYPVTLLERLAELRSEQYMVDVTLCAEGKEIACHRLVLAAYSDYFHAMFNGAHSESKKDKIEIGGVSAEALQLLVDFAYTSKIAITTDNVQPLLKAANMLQVSHITKACEVFLRNCLKTESCLGIWALADLVSSTKLSEMARDIALKSFDEVHMTEEFLQLPVDFLKMYLSDDGLHAKKEERVLEAIVLWARHDHEERQRHLTELMECVDFANVDQNYLENILKNDKVLAGVREIRKCKLIRNQSAHARPRKIRQEEILVLGGESQEEEDGINHTMYRLDLNGICVGKSALQQSFQKSKGIAACVVEDDVIVTGGDESEHQAWRYRPSQDSWTKLGSVRNGRSFHGMASVNGQVYVVGGYDKTRNNMPRTSVEVYNKSANSWRKRAPLIQAVVDFGITTCQEKIYVFGGETFLFNEYMETHAVQCYDPIQNVWTNMYRTHLHRPMRGIRACTVDSKIYLVGGKLDCVLRFNHEENIYEELAEGLVPWRYCSATVRGSEIFITGGQPYGAWDPQATLEDEYVFYRTSLATIQCYNTSNDTMIREKDAPFKLVRHCTVTIAKD